MSAEDEARREELRLNLADVRGRHKHYGHAGAFAASTVDSFVPSLREWHQWQAE